MFVLLPLFTVLYYLCFYVLFYAGIKSRMLFWTFLILALVSPPLALFIYIFFKCAGHGRMRLQLGLEVNAFSKPNSPEYQKYASDTTPYVSVTCFSASLFAPLHHHYLASYFCSAGLLAVSATCATVSLSVVDLFV